MLALLLRRSEFRLSEKPVPKGLRISAVDSKSRDVSERSSAGRESHWPFVWRRATRNMKLIRPPKSKEFIESLSESTEKVTVITE
jgi:hypothetical protein